jgi:hypothetical protein
MGTMGMKWTMHAHSPPKLSLITCQLGPRNNDVEEDGKDTLQEQHSPEA